MMRERGGVRVGFPDRLIGLSRGGVGSASLREIVALVASLVALGCVLMCSGAASAAPQYTLSSSFSPPAGLGEPVGVAVDNSEGPDKGDVYVTDRGKETIDEFSHTGTLLAQVAMPGVTLDQVSVDPSGNVYVAGASDGVIYKLAPGLSSSEEFIKGLQKPTEALNFQTFGLIYVAEESGKVLLFSELGEPWNFGRGKVAPGENTALEMSGAIHAIAFDATGQDLQDIYLSTLSTSSSDLLRYTAGETLSLTEAVLTPQLGRVTGLTVGSSGSGLYADEQAPGGGMQIVNYKREEEIGSPATPVDTFGTGVLSNRADGVGVDGDSGDVYVADAGNRAVYMFEPSLDLTIGSRGASIRVSIDPEGEPTTLRVEYGPNIPYESATPVTGVGSGSEQVSVPIHLSGLQPDVLYHMRLEVTKGSTTMYGGDVTFRTYAEGATNLPDGRVYEMITPAANNFDSEVYEMSESAGGLLATTFPFQASLDGSAIAYVAWPTVGGTGSTGIGNTGDEFVANRSAQGGWRTQNVTPTGASLSAQYQAFSADLSTGILAVPAVPPFTATDSLQEPPTETAYTGLYAHAFGESLYRPLFTAATPYRPAPTGERGGFGSSERYDATEKSPIYAGASADMTRRLFEANDDLLVGHGSLEEELSNDVKGEVEALDREREMREEGASDEEVAALAAVDDRDELYTSDNGSLGLVNVSSEGKVVPDATFGGLPSPPSQLTESARGLSLSHVISNDGSRIFWTSLERQAKYGAPALPKAIFVREDGSRTVQVSAGSATFWTASSDGRFAYYTEAGKLWRFDVDSESRSELAGAGGGVQGVIGVNEAGEDGSFVYFVSREALSADANSAGQLPVDGADNLYLIEAVGGTSHTVFVGALSPSDRSDWLLEIGARSSLLAPDGQSLEFAARENLTGVAYPGEGTEEVYVFDARDGSLHCASCTAQASGGRESAGVSLLYHYRVISEDGGRVFFDSEAPLVSQDVNGTQDVYEWERDGSGECRQAAGCLYLLSNGLAEGKAFFVDASASGDDAFIVTRQRLVPEDENEGSDLFDARVGGVKPVAPPECSGTGCQGPPASSPVFATPASETFAGVGNLPTSKSSAVSARARSRPLTRAQKLHRALARCAKRRGPSRRKCVVQARKKFGGEQAKHTTRRGK